MYEVHVPATGDEDVVEIDLEPSDEDILVAEAVHAVHDDLVECGLVERFCRPPLQWDMLDVWAEWPDNLSMD